jgi:hypothetical protein
MLIAIVLILVVAPLAFTAVGALRSRNPASAARERGPWPWRGIVASALLYTLAFNLTFFVQELFLVLPKALTPGLHPTLYHNNHTWTGANPLASLFQGTGALATALLGLASAVWLRRTRTTCAWRRLLLFWFAFAGVFMALPQVVLGALLPNGDVGMALGYFGLGDSAKTAIGLAALVAIPAFALWLLRPLLASAEHSDEVADAAGRMGFVFRTATLPALLAIASIVPFRVPREWIEVALVPAVVTVVGLVWLQAAAWCVGDVRVRVVPARWPLAALLIAVIALLAIFQLLLRPGIAF